MHVQDRAYPPYRTPQVMASMQMDLVVQSAFTRSTVADKVSGAEVIVDCDIRDVVTDGARVVVGRERDVKCGKVRMEELF